MSIWLILGGKLNMLPFCVKMWQLYCVCINVAEAVQGRGTPQPAGVKAERTVSGW